MKIARGSIALLFLVAATSSARAATQFQVTIKNTSNVQWSPGVFTLQPLLNIGNSPQPGTRQYATYAYSKFDCSQQDAICSGASTFLLCEDANEDTLVQRWGLTSGTNAWIPPSTDTYFGFDVLGPGDSTTVTITANPGDKLYYVSKIGIDTSYVDQIVMAHQTGSPGTLGIPLFDANGLPLQTITFDVHGYSVDSSSPTNGSAANCATTCPPNPTNCWVAVGNNLTGNNALPAQPTQPTFPGPTTLYTGATGTTTDGLCIGDVTGTSSAELVVSAEGQGWAGTYNQNGSGHGVVLNTSGTGNPAATFDAPAGRDFMGFPMVENLDGSGTAEILWSEFEPRVTTGTPSSASVYARKVSGTTTTQYWTASNLGYPGFWNMGPSAGNVRTDINTSGNLNEIILPDYDGDLVVLQRDASAPANLKTLNSYNLYTSNSGERIYGHVAIGEVWSANNGDEIVVFGATTGKIYVFGTQTGTGTPLKLLWTSTVMPNGGYAFGSGPAIGDIDGDGNNEIVVATAGGSSAGGVFAFRPSYSTGCEYKWTTTGFDYSWSSPVIGEVTGDTRKDVVVMSSDAKLSVLTTPTRPNSGCATGTIFWEYTVGAGGNAWFTPALANLSGDSTLEVVAASYKTLEVIDVKNKTMVWRFSDNTGQFYPSALIERGATSANIYVSGWSNAKVFKFVTPGTVQPTAGTGEWLTFMGNNQRTGAR